MFVSPSLSLCLIYLTAYLFPLVAEAEKKGIEAAGGSATIYQ